jgi:predicted CoA-binding protein
MNTDSHSASDIRKILELRNIAVVGMSNTEGKPANFVPKYLIENGYNGIDVVFNRCMKVEHSMLSD